MQLVIINSPISQTTHTKMAIILTCSSISLVCLLAVTIQLLFFLPSPPIFLDIPSSILPPPSNSKLQQVMKLGEGILKEPEDVAVDKNGVLYTVTRDGSVMRMHRNGSWEKWWNFQSQSLLGITTTACGHLILCDADKGLVKLSEEGETLLTSHVNGVKIRFADDVIESWDGTLYFSVASTKFSFSNWQLDVLESKPHGSLLKYDPSSNTTSVVLEALAFANGVALSQNQDYLVVCETWKFRCLKYWLEGEKKGQSEIFIENLPGRPDNINLAPDGSFWIALLQLKLTWPRCLYNLAASRYIIRALSYKLNIPAVSVAKKAMVVNVGSHGNVIRGFDDPTGMVMTFVTSAVQFEGNLYFGSLYNHFVGKLTLQD